MMRLQMASLASLMLVKVPRMWIFWSAITMRVRVAFSMAYLVFPSYMDRYVASADDKTNQLTHTHIAVW